MKYDWKDAGEEWSEPWGNSEAQWFGTILPRIRDYLPTLTILEIASGHGRWTRFLKEQCTQLWAVDRIADSAEKCRRRFAADSHVQCYVNDGRSLPMIPDGSVDFVFTFDSLVHTKCDIVGAYLCELGKKLKIGGKGFIHHSNFGEYANSFRERVPEAIVKPLIKIGVLDWAHHRSPDMTAALFLELCARAGLHCLSQELINWRGRRLIDCFSIITRGDSSAQTPTRMIRNRDFMREAAAIRRQSVVTPFVAR
jgi:SAM-dependent methyltransferase